MTTIQSSPAEASARQLAGALGATIAPTPDGLLMAWLPLGWSWHATGTQVIACEEWPLLLTMMRRGCLREGGAS
jgi:hypothetical protein